MGDKLKERPEPLTLAVAVVPLAEFGHLTPLEGEKKSFQSSYSIKVIL